MTDSQSLLAEYRQNGSDAAFRELVQRFVDLVYSTALRLVGGDTHGAEDVTQTVFMNLAHKATTLPEDVSLGGWLHRDTYFVATNLTRGDHRRQARERQAAEMNALQNHSEADYSLVAPLLDEAINELGEADRTAILLRFFEQQDFRAVGQALGSNEDAARMRVTRALEKLEAFLKRRGVTTSAASLGVVLMANVVQAAPIGLAITISTAAALAGTTISTAATKAAMHWVNLKSISAVVAAAIAVGTGTYLIQHREKVRLQSENATLVAQRDKLVADRDAALASVVGNAEELDRLRKDRSELLRLRGEIGVLRRQPMGSEKVGNENRPPSAGEESKGGLAGIALRPSDLGGRWTRSIVLLLDPLSNPPEIFSLVTNAMRRARVRPRTAAEIAESNARQIEENRKFLRSTLSQIGAEAKIILEYRNPEYEQSFTMTIYRSKTSEAADSQWRIRHANEEFKSATVAGADVIFVKQGQVFPGGGVTSKPVVELREGILIIEVTPGNPEPDDPGFNLARQQVERIRRHPELVSSLSDVSRPEQEHQEPSPQTASPPAGGNQPSAQKTSTPEIDGINIISVPLGQALPIYAAFSGTEVDVDENVKQLLNLIQFRLVNTNAMTRSEAVALFDQAFREQAGIEITHPATNRSVMRLRRK